MRERELSEGEEGKGTDWTSVGLESVKVMGSGTHDGVRGGEVRDRRTEWGG